MHCKPIPAHCTFCVLAGYFSGKEGKVAATTASGDCWNSLQKVKERRRRRRRRKEFGRCEKIWDRGRKGKGVELTKELIAACE